MTKIVVLDSLFESLAVEREVAARYGATIERWDGSPSSLREANIIAHVRTVVDEPMIVQLAECRVIARFGSGLDTVDVDAARDAGITVVGVRDYCVRELASHTLALAFALRRRISETAGVLDRGWDQLAVSTPVTRGENVSIVGLGSVGRAVAVAMVALGHSVSVVSKRPSEDILEIGCQPASLDHALERADTLLLHCALDESTRGFLNGQRLRRLPQGAIVVNTARLALLDERAIAEALTAGRLGGVGIDAALPGQSPLRGILDNPRLIVTPHVGWYSRQAADELRQRGIDNALRAFTDGDNQREGST